jgi:hypothetical protein
MTSGIRCCLARGPNTPARQAQPACMVVQMARFLDINASACVNKHPSTAGLINKGAVCKGGLVVEDPLCDSKAR